MRPTPRPPDEWADLVRLVRAYARRKYGWSPVAITIHAPFSGADHREPLPLLDVGEATVPAAKIHEWASGLDPQHLSDFRSVYWPGLGRFNLSEMQAKIVRQLWEAYQDGTWEVQQLALLRRAGSESMRLIDVFKKSPAWGTLIVAGEVAGSYRLPPVPGEEEPSADDEE